MLDNIITTIKIPTSGLYIDVTNINPPTNTAKVNSGEVKNKNILTTKPKNMQNRIDKFIVYLTKKLMSGNPCFFNSSILSYLVMGYFNDSLSFLKGRSFTNRKENF